MDPDLKLFELPSFEGNQPKAGRLKLTGNAATTVRPLQYQDEIIVVCKARVIGVDHDQVTEGKTTFLARIHKLNVLEVHELIDGEVELERGRTWSRQVADAQNGDVPLWDTERGDD